MASPNKANCSRVPPPRPALRLQNPGGIPGEVGENHVCAGSFQAGQDFEHDPLFVDPEHGNYHLKAESPAFKLGFEQIPVDAIGPYEDPLRATWPIQEAEGAREKPTRLEQQ